MRSLGQTAGSIAVILKLLAEIFACEEYTAFDCAERKIHLLGNFVVFITGHEHVERNPVFIGE